MKGWLAFKIPVYGHSCLPSQQIMCLPTKCFFILKMTSLPLDILISFYWNKLWSFCNSDPRINSDSFIVSVWQTHKASWFCQKNSDAGLLSGRSRNNNLLILSDLWSWGVLPAVAWHWDLHKEILWYFSSKCFVVNDLSFTFSFHLTGTFFELMDITVNNISTAL